MITKRDQDILNFIQEFHVATTNQIHKLFFAPSNYRYCTQRLKFLTDSSHIKKTRSTIDNCNAYYIDRKPAQVHHDLIRTELYTNMKQRYKILEWHNEMTVGNIRPDAFAYINDYGIVFPVFIEIHLNNKFDFDKYMEFVKNNDLRSMFGIIPRVIICTDRQVTIPNIGIRFKVIGIDMSGLELIFK